MSLKSKCSAGRRLTSANSMSCEEFTKLAQSSGPENIGPERPLSGGLAAWAVLSPSRITLEYNEKIRPQPDLENAFARASGGEDGIRTRDTLLAYTHLAGERLRPLGHLSKTADISGSQGAQAVSSKAAAQHPSGGLPLGVCNCSGRWLRIPWKMGIDSTASWAAIPRLGRSGRPAHRVRLDPLGQAVSSCSRACACFRRQGATGARYGRAGREWHRQWSDPRLLRVNARPGAGW